MTRVKLGAIFMAFLFWGIFEGLKLGASFSVPMLPAWSPGIVFGGILCLLMLGVSWLFLRKDSLTFSDLGMTLAKGSAGRFLVSFLAGMALFGCMFALYFWLTPVEVRQVENLNIGNAVFISLVIFLLLGSMEEVVFRGYFLKKLETAVGVRIAIYVTSVAFGLYHGLTMDSITGPAVWGLWYGALAYWSKGLAIPIGFHAGLNYVQALFSQKEKWIEGVWTIDLTEEVTPLTIHQLTMIFQVLVFITGVLLVELYISKSRKAGAQ